MGPLDDPPTANKGGRGPLFWINPPGLKLAGASGKTLDGTAERLRRRRELDLFRDTAGQSASLLPVLGWKLVLRWGSSGEHVAGFLVFELGALCALVLRQRLLH